MSISLRDAADQTVNAIDHTVHALTEFVGEAKTRLDDMPKPHLSRTPEPDPKRLPWLLVILAMLAVGVLAIWFARRCSRGSKDVTNDGLEGTARPTTIETRRSALAS